jgi:hypothetical protein
MKHSNERTGFAMLLAPVLAVWIFLGCVSGAAAQADEDALDRQYAEQTLRVSLWLDKNSDQVYRRGEPIKVTFQTNEDAYAVVYRIDADGRVSILWPTSRYSDGFVFGGHQYRLPSREGDRLRAGEDPGMGYVQAVVSRYPFDLRELALDFHHENGGTRYDYYVAGDPFLAMNEVNYAVTGLEDAGAYVVTNYASYYVHEKVDHPRYLCFQCHDDADYAPYADTCAVSIHYDYGWMNEWWVSYGYYPAYYYPIYYYVDPWTSGRWVNYWYDPWYRWPVVVHYGWPYHCYDWYYSPYWRCDAWSAHEQGRRRHTPLDRSSLARDRSEVRTRTKNELVTAEKPADDRLRHMRERVVADRGDTGRQDPRLGDVGPGGGRTRDVSPVSRSQVEFQPDQRIRTSPGLRVPDSNTASRGRGDDRRTVSDPRRASGPKPDRSGDGTVRDEDRRLRGGTTTVRPGKETRDTSRQTIRPVDPRGDSRRVWTNRRSSGSSSVRPQAPTRPSQPSNDRSSSVRRPTRREAAPAPPRGGSSSGSSGVRRAPKPSKPSAPPSRPSGGGSRGGGSRGSKSGGRSSGGRG